MTRFTVIGSHPINVTSGHFSPGDTDVELTADEALNLQRAGAVVPVEGGPAAALAPDSAGLVPESQPREGAEES